MFCGNFATLIPVTFVLGFYVSLLVTRWWKQFESIPWPDSSAVWISTCIKGHDERGRLMRRTIIRYINLCLILTFRLISLPVKKRFPTLQHLEDAGILVGRERQVNKYWGNKVHVWQNPQNLVFFDELVKIGFFEIFCIFSGFKNFKSINYQQFHKKSWQILQIWLDRYLVVTFSIRWLNIYQNVTKYVDN